MINKHQKDPRQVLDDIATSNRKLVMELEDRVIEGRHITATEIPTIDGQLRVHVEDLLAISSSLRDEKSEG
jgi:hypothetical protein